jgi:dipeptidyl aminopeptidase/acylaminoacyl peptidase
MSQPRIAPYGTWASPITAELIVAETVRLGAVALDGDDICWVEGRPAEGGRSVIVRRTPDGTTADVNPPPYDARSRVHEYGGGAFAVHRGAVYFANFADQRLHAVTAGQAPRPLTPEGPWRYADGVVDAARGRLVCVREDHAAAGEPENTIVAVDLAGGDAGRVLVRGNDFYAAPRLSPDGERLAWLAWDHPNMPWDDSALCVARIAADGTLAEHRRVAGGDREAVCQPAWSPDGRLHYVSDRSGWWNLYRDDDGAATALCPLAAEFGRPHWTFGVATYGFEASGMIAAAYCVVGDWRLARLDLENGGLADYDMPYTSIDGLAVAGGRAAFIGAGPTEPPAVVALDTATGRSEVLRRSTAVALDRGCLSTPEPVVFPTEDRHTAHGFYYPPRNRDFVGPAEETPPLLVISHGGPTGATTSALSLGVQFWTSRGFAVLDVNYRGSTGYGTAYRRLLEGQWGVADVDDCCNGARWLAARGLADPARLAIRGSSAGGYTTLSALTFRDVFKAGASHYGIGDLEALMAETHKFESRYDHSLIGPPETARDRYRERSPIHHADQLDCPVIFFQGLDDKVVPPNQAETMVAALRAKRLPVAYLAFAGEGHGFRKAETIRRTLETELYFYGRLFGFDPADDIAPVAIDNLPPA